MRPRDTRRDCGEETEAMEKINLDNDVNLSAEELEQVKGGLLLPAVQKIREAAARSSAGGEMGYDVKTSQKV